MIDDAMRKLIAVRAEIGAPVQWLDAPGTSADADDEPPVLEVPDLGRVQPIRCPAGPLSGRVALVTGAAQGFGLGIAEGLVRHGAVVALADLQEQRASEEARRINAEAGWPAAAGVPVDVTNPESVGQAVRDVVHRFGGVDILVSNAGVLRAGSVFEQSPSEFEFVTRVNYLGFFYCVQAVAPVMAAQHERSPEQLFDIVQVNSKSGLQGSNRNGAYAGSKFGGIGLVQSFAMELVESGIKVNAVCPGNFFEGPLWSDPENGLFAQYLKTGKVPGARTIDDVRRFYESKVPMGRGCRVEDVLRAILYLVEQQYETGQALPVTGGQVMVH